MKTKRQNSIEARKINIRLLFGVITALTAMITPDTAQSAGEVVVAGSSWMGGKGVDVRNNADALNCWGSSYTVCPTSGQSVYTGCEWQCVELTQRLYTTR